MYTADTAAWALGVTQKSFDNFVARAVPALIPPGRRGKSRQIDDKALEVVAIAMLLCRDLGMPSLRAAEFAGRLVQDPEGVPVGTLGTLRFDVERLRSVLRRALADAIDGRVPRMRGRPQAVKEKRGVST
jgi:hypothetical protein